MLPLNLKFCEINNCILYSQYKIEIYQLFSVYYERVNVKVVREDMKYV